MENHAGRPEVIEARRAGRGDSRRFSATEQENRFYFARLLPDGNVLRLSVAAARVRELESGYLWSARPRSSSPASSSSSIGTAASRRFSEPIARLTEAASAIAAGLPRDLPREGGQEVQLLAAALSADEGFARAGGRAGRGRAAPDGPRLREASRRPRRPRRPASRPRGQRAVLADDRHPDARRDARSTTSSGIRALYEIFEASLKSGGGDRRGRSGSRTSWSGRCWSCRCRRARAPPPSACCGT